MVLACLWFAAAACSKDDKNYRGLPPAESWQAPSPASGSAAGAAAAQGGMGNPHAGMGTGDPHYHEMFQRLVMHYPQQVAVRFTFNTELSHHIIAGSDMLLMPSQFEPCGLTQMLAMRYGCIPIVHQIGGLADTVQELDPMLNTGNGFCFQRYDPFQFFASVVRALEAYRFTESWSDLMQRAMLADNSWDASAEQYVALYRRALELAQVSAPRSGTNG